MNKKTNQWKYISHFQAGNKGNKWLKIPDGQEEG